MHIKIEFIIFVSLDSGKPYLYFSNKSGMKLYWNYPLIFAFHIFYSINNTFAQMDKVDNWLLNFFRQCTLQILGSRFEFGPKIIIYSSKMPVVIDVYEFPVNYGRYNLTALRTKDQTYKTAFSHFAPKYTSCVSQLFFPFYIRGPVEWHIEAIRNSVLGMLFSNENPHFLVYMVRITELVRYLERPVGFGIGRESITSIPILALPSIQEVRPLCVTCSAPLQNPLGNILESTSVTTTAALKHAVENLSRNLNWQPLTVSPPMRVRRMKYYCSLNVVGLNTPIGECVTTSLAMKYNFTITYDYHPMMVLGILNRQVSYDHFDYTFKSFCW